jgi:hypothetical protein
MLMAGLLPLELLAELTSVGTLFAFFLVCVSVAVLRRRHPTHPRGFKVPGGTSRREGVLRERDAIYGGSSPTGTLRQTTCSFFLRERHHT